MSVDWELLRVLRKAQEPTVKPCGKDAGCVQAQATVVALDAVYKAMEKPQPYLTNIDYNCAGDKRHTLCCHKCYPSMAAKHGVFSSYGKVFEGACTYCGTKIGKEEE